MNRCVDCKSKIGPTAMRCRKCAATVMWRDTKFRAKHAKAMSKAMQDLDINRRRSETMKKHWCENPEHWNGAIESMREGYMKWAHSAKGKQQRRNLSKAQWADLDKRAKLLGGLNAPEERRRRSKHGKALMGDPERAKRHAQAVSDAWKRGAYDGVFRSPSSLEMIVLGYLESLPFDVISQYRPIGYTKVYDFYLLDLDILIEVDGDYWHSRPGIKENDIEKTMWAFLNGYYIMRICEADVHSVAYMSSLCEELTTVI